MLFKANGDLCTVYMCFWAKDDFSVTCSCTGATVNSHCNEHLCKWTTIIWCLQKRKSLTFHRVCCQLFIFVVTSAPVCNIQTVCTVRTAVHVAVSSLLMGLHLLVPHLLTILLIDPGNNKLLLIKYFLKLRKQKEKQKRGVHRMNSFNLQFCTAVDCNIH